MNKITIKRDVRVLSKASIVVDIPKTLTGLFIQLKFATSSSIASCPFIGKAIVIAAGCGFVGVYVKFLKNFLVSLM